MKASDASSEAPHRLTLVQAASLLRDGALRAEDYVTALLARCHAGAGLNAFSAIDDQAVLAAAREAAEGRVIAVVQPHRYTRLQSLFDDFCLCFNDADMVIVADVYPAGEAPIPGIDRDALVAGMAGRGHRDVMALESREALAPLIAERAKPGDMVICLGAGSITRWAEALPGELAG